MKWSFAIEPIHGDLHVFEHEMPEAENLVVVDIKDAGNGMHVIAAADASALRDLLGTPSIREVVRHVGPDVADELDDMLTAIHRLVERRTNKLRSEDEGEPRQVEEGDGWGL